jgi:hypothetical protein
VTSVEQKSTFESAAGERAEKIFRALRANTFQATDRMFAWLIVFEWLAAMAAASLISPQIWPTEPPDAPVWAGARPRPGLIYLLPLYLSLQLAGRRGTPGI